MYFYHIVDIIISKPSETNFKANLKLSAVHLLNTTLIFPADLGLQALTISLRCMCDVQEICFFTSASFLETNLWSGFWIIDLKQFCNTSKCNVVE